MEAVGGLFCLCGGRWAADALRMNNRERIKETKYFRVDEEPFEERKGVFEATVG